MAETDGEGKGGLKRDESMCMFDAIVHIGSTPMRTNIDIDEKLLAEAMAASGKRTKKETVHEALELLVRVRSKQTAIRSLRGKIDWEGDLDAMRRG